MASIIKTPSGTWKAIIRKVGFPTTIKTFRTGGGNASWNSAHGSRGCSQPKLVSTGGAGLLYCFAAN